MTSLKNSLIRLTSPNLLLACICLLLSTSSQAEVAANIFSLALVDHTIAQPVPVYPAESLKSREDGITVLKVLVGASGEVKEIAVEKSSKHKNLDQAALEGVKQWKFIPKQADGVTVEDWVSVTICFSGKEVVILTPKQINKRYWVKDQNGCKLFDNYLQQLAKYEWNGECHNGYIEGTGEVIAVHEGKTVSKLKGTFHKGMLYGEAYAQTLDSEFNGMFVHGLKNGKGTLAWNYGMRYEGDFLNNLMNGHAIVSWPNGVRVEGEFDKGTPVGNKFTAPRFTHMARLKFPETLAGFHKSGAVTLQALVDEKGVISQIEVIRSDHPAFEREVFKVVASSEIKPAMVNGKAVPSLFRYPFRFGSNSEDNKPYSIGLDPEVETTGDVPEQVKLDSLPTFKVVAPLVYPFELFQKKVTGKVTATVLIDPTGHPAEIKITEASHEDFAAATRAMLASCMFTPAIKEQVGTWASLKIGYEFSRNSKDTLYDSDVYRIFRHSKEVKAPVYKLAHLDQKPQAIYSPVAEVPYGYQVKGAEKVLVEFTIDKNGAVQLPHILKSTNPELDWLAMTTVSRWFFKPPTVKGEPVDVLVSIPVIYSAANN